MSDNLDFSWFDLKKYDGVKEFTLSDWFNQLATRANIYNYHKDDSFHFFDENLQKKIIDSPDDFVILIRKKIASDSKSIICDPLLKNNYLKNSINSKEIRPINETSLLDLYFTIDQSSKLKKIIISLLEWHSFLAQGESEDRLIRNETSDLILSKMNEKISQNSTSRRLLTVDYTAPEGLLMEQFRALVREEKKSLKVKRKRDFSKSDLDSWVNLNILPCIDLKIYTEINKKTLTQNKLGLRQLLNFKVGQKIKLIGIKGSLCKSARDNAKRQIVPENILLLQDVNGR